MIQRRQNVKNLLTTTALLLALGGTAYAAPAQFSSYQAQASDIDASKFIGQTVYATSADVAADQAVKAGAEKDWDNIGEINELVIGRDGNVKAVVLGVGGFLGMGEKNVAVSMNDIRFIKNGDGANDYFLVVNSSKEALNSAPAFKTPDEVRAAADTSSAVTTDTASNSTMTTPNDAAATDTTASNTMANPDNKAAATDTTTTASTTANGAVQSTMDENRVRLTAPTVTRDGYQSAQIQDLTADKLQGARVYGPKDEDVGEINHLVMNDSGQVKLFVLDIGGFLGIGEHQIAVTPQELNIVRDAKGDDVRVYIDANKQALQAQPEYKMQ
jgi:hypothetical protein